MAVVQKTYWGLPWWDRKLVLLTFFVGGGTGFERGETYFVDGNRESRWLTRRLPIFEIHCTRTVALKYAEIDLRALSDGPHHGIYLPSHILKRVERTAQR
jgi:hypothetical protein